MHCDPTPGKRHQRLDEYMRRRLLIGGLTLALTGLTGSWTAAGAAAPHATVSISNTPTAVPFAQTNGDVLAVADFSVGGTPEVAFGGDFTTVTTPNKVVHPATNFAVVNETSGDLVFAATGLDSTDYVRAIAYQAGLLYLGGDFTAFAGQARKHLVALTVPGFAVDPAWNPGASGHVNALAVSTTPLAVFTTGASGTVRALNPTTGRAIWSDPVPYGGLRALLMDPSNGGLYVGGFFDSIRGFANHGLIELNATTGAPVTSFAPVLKPNVPANGGLTGDDPISLALDTAVTPHAIIEGGGGKTNLLHLFNPTTGAVIWDRGMIGDTQAVIGIGDSVVAGYHRTRINKSTGIQWPYFAAQLQASNGDPESWAAGLSGMPPTTPADGGNNGVRGLAYDAHTGILIVAGAFRKYGQTCNLDVTLTCTGGKPMASLAEYRVTD
jgi:hypothetical protein